MCHEDDDHHGGDRAARPQRHWHEAIANAYFPLDLRFRDPNSFSGDLSIWELGDVSLSRLTSEALQYRRLPHHFKAERDEHFLVTVPAGPRCIFPNAARTCAAIPAASFSNAAMSPMNSATTKRLTSG